MKLCFLENEASDGKISSQLISQSIKSKFTYSNQIFKLGFLNNEVSNVKNIFYISHISFYVDPSAPRLCYRFWDTLYIYIQYNI